MIRLSDALFISSEPDYDTVIAIRIKNGEYYFLGWMENAEGYKYVIAKHPEENLLDRDCFSDANSLYCNIISCDGYNDAYLLAKSENPYSDFVTSGGKIFTPVCLKDVTYFISFLESSITDVKRPTANSNG